MVRGLIDDARERLHRSVYREFPLLREITLDASKQGFRVKETTKSPECDAYHHITLRLLEAGSGCPNKHSFDDFVSHSDVELLLHTTDDHWLNAKEWENHDGVAEHIVFHVSNDADR